MPRKPVELTDAKIRGITPPPTGQAEWSDNLVPGLRIRIGKSGAKTVNRRANGSAAKCAT